MILIFNKPCEVLSQFTKEIPIHKTLADFGFPKDVYPIGRLDANSEGLLLLSNDKKWTERLLKPYHGHKRTYHVQVEGVPAGRHCKAGKGVLIRRLARLAGALMKGSHYPERHPRSDSVDRPHKLIEMRLIEKEPSGPHVTAPSAPRPIHPRAIDAHLGNSTRPTRTRTA